MMLIHVLIHDSYRPSCDVSPKLLSAEQTSCQLIGYFPLQIRIRQICQFDGKEIPQDKQFTKMSHGYNLTVLVYECIYLSFYFITFYSKLATGLLREHGKNNISLLKCSELCVVCLTRVDGNLHSGLK